MRFLPSSISDNAVTNITGTTVGDKHGQDVNVIGINGASTDEALAWDTTSTANACYVGVAAPGSLTSAAVWKIIKYNTATGLGKWADGEATYTQIWDNRTGLTYT
jgi:hypothetical protein